MFELVAIRIPTILAGLCLLVGVGVNFANVVGRYLLAAPIFWAEEAMIYLSLWAVFLGFIAVTASNAHLKMDFFVSALPSAIRIWLDRLGYAIGAVAMGFVAWQSGGSVVKLWAFDMKSVAMQVPVYAVHAALLVGFAASALVAFLMIWKRAQ